MVNIIIGHAAKVMYFTEQIAANQLSAIG
jgi:hypothetical protein